MHYQEVFFGCGSYRMDPKREARERHKRKKELPLRSKGLPPVFLGKKKKIWFAKALPLPFICATSESKACPFTPPGWNTSCDFEISINLKKAPKTNPPLGSFPQKLVIFHHDFLSKKNHHPSATPLHWNHSPVGWIVWRVAVESQVPVFKRSYQGDGTRPKTPGYYSCNEWILYTPGFLTNTLLAGIYFPSLLGRVYTSTSFMVPFSSFSYLSWSKGVLTNDGLFGNNDSGFKYGHLRYTPRRLT